MVKANGNRRQAEEFAITSVDDLMRAWMRQLREGVSPEDIIASIKPLFAAATGEDRYELATALLPFLTMARRHHEQLQVIDEVMEAYPDDIQLPMTKANIYLYSLDDFEEALKWIDIAIERADRGGCFRREALGCKARILLKLGRGDELSDVLEKIMALRLEKGAIDIGRERDFVDLAPPGLIRKEVLDRYNEFRPKRATDTSTGIPPKFEPPEEAM